VICASVNEEVVHGIPGPRKLENGDLITLDIGVIWKGYHADAARTFAVGSVDEEKKRLIRATAESLDQAIEVIAVGARVWQIGAAVQKYAEERGFSVVKEFVGHGIGRELHEEPQVPNYVDDGMRRRLGSIKAGLVIAVEPMLNVGSDRVKTLDDGWTVVTRDGELSAHFEDTIAVTSDGPIVLTRHAS
jgi:methionyl aminopeptidase